jgi:hypothetical protein
MPRRALSLAAHPRYFLEMLPRLDSTLHAPRALLGALFALLAACDEEPSAPELTPVTSGTISGIPFTVNGGTVYQAGADGPLFADSTGGRIVFDEGPLALGMSDPDLLHVRTFFALSSGGSLQIAGFGDAGSTFDTGVSVGLGRLPDAGFVYELRVAGSLLADSAFEALPAIGSSEQWIVVELYADSIPGSPAGEAGAALWPLDDLTPSPTEELLGCGLEPASDPNPRTGETLGYALDDAWLLEVEIVDQIVGPCT